MCTIKSAITKNKKNYNMSSGKKIIHDSSNHCDVRTLSL